MIILLINVCKEKLHFFEFVKPIKEILSGKEVVIKHYSKIQEDDLRRADKIIICGTSLKDNQFTEEINKFEWIKNYKKPILGICAGMQIISLVYGAKIKKETEIGFYEENFTHEFLGMSSKKEVYYLHNNYTTLPIDFESFTKGEIPQAIKHKTREIYGVLFHPEVRNENVIETFAKI